MITSLTARSAWRLSAPFNTSPSFDVADYSIARQDGGALDATVAMVWSGGIRLVEIALSAPLEPRLVHVLTVVGQGSAAVSYITPPMSATGQAMPDPAVALYGTDLAWISEALDARRDIPRRIGIDCVRHDLVAIAFTSPGELVARPDEGGGLLDLINGAAAGTVVAETRARLRQQWTRDPRVVSGGVALTAIVNGNGEIDFNAQVKTVGDERTVALAF